MTRRDRPRAVKKSREKIPFTDWIREKGIDYVADALNVHPATVRFWRIGKGYPRVEQMRTIKKISRGVVGYEQIIDGRPE